MISNDLNYDPFEDLATILSARESLDEIDRLIHATRKYKTDLETEILKDREDESSSEQITNVEFDFEKIFREIEETRSFASSTQSTISGLTEGISHLDNAKRNLIQCMTLFQNLKILTDSYVQCKSLLEGDNYKEAASSFKIMSSLAETTFRPYKSVDEINKLLNSISRLRMDTYESIKRSYGKALGGKVPEGHSLERELREGACDLLESGTSGKTQIIDWCVSKLLYEMREIFQVDDEAGSLENISRRFIYYKKVLNNYNTSFARFFPQEWEIPLRMTRSFYESTRKDLQILLKNQLLHDKNSSIDLFMRALQDTLDFEKYIDVRFSRKLRETSLSACFEPYISLWISHQDKLMEEKMLSYMSAGTVDFSNNSLVIPSSADLFRTYRSVLSQTFELIENKTDEKILLALATFFTKWLVTYSNKILKPLLLPDNVDIHNKEETIKYTVALINTADYCSTTIDQLEEKLTAVNQNSSRISDAFISVKNLYGELLTSGTNLLLNRILKLDLDFAWKEFYNTDWAHVLVEDYSRYAVTLRNVLSFSSSDASLSTKPALEMILTQFNRDVYCWNFLDKVIELIAHEFTGHIIRLLQRTPPLCNLGSPRKFDPQRVINIGEQLLLDLELLKHTLLTLPDSVASVTNSSQSASFKRVRKHMDVDLDRILQFIKLLVIPVDSADDYSETYKQLTNGNYNSSVWAFVLSLKGVPWDLALWKQHWSAFDLDSDEQTGNDEGKDILIFQWNVQLIRQFEFNMGRVQDPAWSKFIKNDLKISTPSRTPSRTQFRNPVIQTDLRQQQPQSQPKSPVANVKNLVSNSRFFNRGF
ncbi:hypothetical protein HG536_0E03920 [Torulaspora globosa]|uniref:Vps53 N-terminal domain-containing protein n=1 Tax=Torulaspora globosa TaxID=48254 RepID=A0A7G3ZIZ5_9SACH|nr:uncharacterized protein HG536_0E03920 [Torulaspora globosa]QLL33481.1 hypothetical protein HG536_0E03920 [Torulaspora globosa]